MIQFIFLHYQGYEYHCFFSQFIFVQATAENGGVFDFNTTQKFGSNVSIGAAANNGYEFSVGLEMQLSMIGFHLHNCFN